MSGIAAIFHADGQPADPQVLAAMTGAMAYRGPDGIANWCEGPVAIGHCLLVSTAEQRRGPQIAGNADSTVQVALDGYLHNPDELRGELKAIGHPVRNCTDAEIVLRAYEAWGSECPVRLEGEFAFVLWDGRRREVFCARDHQGLRPLLYHWDGKRLLVASDATGILAALPEEPKPNLGYLAQVLTWEYYTRDETKWNGIVRLAQAHAMVASSSGLRTSQYWSLPIGQSPPYRKEADYIAHYRELLADSVRRSARSDRPLAIEASGGLDSTALFCMAHHLQRNGPFPAPAIRGYTLAGPPGTGADEIAYPRAVAAELGVKISEHPYFAPPLDWFDRDAACSRDLPLMPNGAMSILEEQAMVADGCRACINGVGGDQWLDGSPFYYSELARRGAVSDLVRAAMADIAAQGMGKTLQLAWRYGLKPAIPAGLRPALLAMRNLVRRRGEDSGQSHPLLTPQAAQMLADRRALWQASLHPDLHARLKLSKWSHPYWSTMFDLNSRQEAQSGLSQRHPLLARRYMTFMAAVPEHLLLKGGITKQLHRKALAGILPDKVRLRTDKAWTDFLFQNLANSIVDRLLKDTSPIVGELVAPEQLSRICEQYRNATIDSEDFFYLMVFIRNFH